MPDTYVGFVDAGVLRSFQKGYFRPQGTVIVNWFRQLEKTHLVGERFLRLYWYDGIRDPHHRQYPQQRRFFDAIGKTPGIQLRLGHLVEREDNRLQQKGVDTRLILDLVRLAGRSVFSTAVLIVNDRDFTEAIRAAQDFGARVLIATANQHTVAHDIRQLADGMITISKATLREMLSSRDESGLSSSA